MAQLNVRRPLAAAAVLASALGGVAGLAGQAVATTYGDPSPHSPVTITDASGNVSIVGGGSISLPAGAHDVSWAGQGGRIAYIGSDNVIYTADFDGSHPVPLAHGTQPSHTVWNASSTAVYWTEGTGATAKIVGTASNGAYWGSVDGGGVPDESFPAVPRPGMTVSVPAGLGVSSPDVAADDADTIVFQTTDAAGNTGIGSMLWVSGVPTYKEVVAPGSATLGGSTPTISDDGKTVAFVRTAADGTKQIFATTLTAGAWSAPVQVTSLAGDHTDPIFEADANPQSVKNLLAFDFAPASGNTTNAPGVYQATAQAGATETSISTKTGGLAIRTDSKTFVSRFAGSTRIDTAVHASRWAWGDHTAQAVVLSRSDQFADALGGAALAAHKGGPLLLTETAGLDPETSGEIGRVLAPGGTVYVLGGTGAISQTVVNQLAAQHYNVVRIGGANRFETAVNIANAVDPNAKSIIVATGTNYPDALSAGAAAASFDGTVVVLTDGNVMPSETNDYIASRVASQQVQYLGAVGGPASYALSHSWTNTDSLVGATRYETSLMVAQRLFGSFPAVGVATGGNWPDSLAGGALMGHVFGPLILADPSMGLTQAANTYLDANRGNANLALVFGGMGALTPYVDQQLQVDLGTAEGSVPVTQAVHAPSTTSHAFPLTTPGVTQR